MATKSSSQELSSLVINKVASPAVYASMVSGGQINADELYLVAGDETVTYTLAQSGDTITLTGSDGSTSSVSADASGAASAAVSAHNSSATAHSDIRNTIPTATSQLTNDSGFITTGDIPEGAAASTTLPAMDGTAATGIELAFARGDHVHPTDTSRAPTSHASTGTTYGKGTSSNYGHVKLSDATDGTSAAASGGVAATPKAVSDALTSAKSYADGISANDFTDTLKSKLEGIESGAQVNTVTSVNSKTGAVNLTYSDVGAAASSHGTHVTFTTTKPVMDGTAAVGTATTVSRSDHVHPTDTSRAAANDLSSHTGNTTIHITASERTAWNAKADADDIPTKTSELTNDSGFITTSDIPEGAAASTTSPKMDGTATAGTELAFARGDHVHPTDTSRAPTSHASSATTYGTGTSSNYGHLKLSDSTSSTSSTNGGIAATPAAVKAAYDLANSKTANTGTVTSVATGNGLTGGTITTSGTISVSFGTTTPASDGTGSAGSATTVARSDHVHPTDTSRAPTSHASTGTTYGKGTSSNYGHVKLSDSTTATTAAASGGTAATPKAVSDALSSAKSYADGLTYSDVGAASSSHTHSAATSSANGFMSSTDKTNLDQLVDDIGDIDLYIQTIAQEEILSYDGSNIIAQDSFKKRFIAYNDYLIDIIEDLSAQISSVNTALGSRISAIESTLANNTFLTVTQITSGSSDSPLLG